jgi:hypothetical protein
MPQSMGGMNFSLGRRHLQPKQISRATIKADIRFQRESARILAKKFLDAHDIGGMKLLKSILHPKELSPVLRLLAKLNADKVAKELAKEREKTHTNPHQKLSAVQKAQNDSRILNKIFPRADRELFVKSISKRLAMLEKVLEKEKNADLIHRVKTLNELIEIIKSVNRIEDAEHELMRGRGDGSVHED